MLWVVDWPVWWWWGNVVRFPNCHAILKAVEAVKVKLWCFKGIVHPTHKCSGWWTGLDVGGVVGGNAVTKVVLWNLKTGS